MEKNGKTLGIEEMLELNEILLGLVRARVPLDAGLSQAANELRQPATRKAIDTLRQAIAAGVTNFGWMRHDPDFEPIRNEPDFIELTTER